MRRAMTVLVAGLVLGSAAAAGCGPVTMGPVTTGPAASGPAASGPAVAGRGARGTAVPQEAPGPAATRGIKIIGYAGYRVDVPVSWPVYWLAAQPHRCVRYDRHAVYVGHPGSDQHCPAHLVGRTETVSIDSGAGGGGRLAGRRVITRYPAWHELALTMRRPGLSITATYASDPAVVERVIASLRSAAAVAAYPAAGRSASALVQAPGRVLASARAQAPVRAPRAGVGRPMAGFDTCTAPSLPAMRAWPAAYAAVGIYIGGANQACDDGNLSAQWVRQVKAMGWYLIPTYVGRQPPCDRFGSRIRPRHAAAEGRAAADDAVARARLFGLHRRAPIYYDMEAYSSRRRRCRTAVLAFLDAWTRRLRARGYVSGVYSSAASGVEDLGSIGSIAGHALVKPRSIWFALWDGRRNLRGDPYVLSSWWPRQQRIKQFAASRWQRHGRFRLQIDRDQVSGAVY